MKSAYRFLASPRPCSYLPNQFARLEYNWVLELDPQEYASLLLRGWRRFGRGVYRPRCLRCSSCLSLRIDAARFRPNRSQRRTRKVNASEVRLTIGSPSPTRQKLLLYHRYHAHQELAKGWPSHEENDLESFHESFVDNPFPSEEWRFELDGELVGLGYVDALPIGLSAIYFIHDPLLARRSLGTWNVLSLIDQAALRGLPHVYLGYYVEGCRSLEYKANFRPNEILGADGTWQRFRP